MSIASKITQLTEIRTAIRNALTGKGVSAASHNYEDFAADIESIHTQGTTQERTVDPATTAVEVLPEEGYDALSKVTVNAMPAGTQGTPKITKVISKEKHRATIGATCTDTTGYIVGELKSSVPSLVYASELVDGEIEITENGTGIDVTNYSTAKVAVPTSMTTQEKTIDPSTTAQTVQPDEGYGGLSKVTVNAMPEGTQGTPTATKTINGNTAIITTSCTDTTGYIEGETKTGDTISVLASELVSGTIDIRTSGTFNVANYAQAIVTAATEAKVGSLIDVTISSNITQVIATVSGYSTNAFISEGHAYIVIPKEYTGTTTIEGYYGDTKLTQTTITITTINRYTATLTVSSWVYNNGVWTGVEDRDFVAFSAPWYYQSGSGNYRVAYYIINSEITVVEESNRIKFAGKPYLYLSENPYSNGPSYNMPGIYLKPISTRGFTKVRVKIERNNIDPTNGHSLYFGYKKDSVPGTGSEYRRESYWDGYIEYYDMRTFDAYEKINYNETEKDITFDIGEPTDNLYLAFLQYAQTSKDSRIERYAYIKEIQFL